MRYDEIKWEDEDDTSSKNKKEQSGDKGEGSFADLLAESEDGFERQNIRVGGKINGIITSINPGSPNILVEIDPLHTGVIDRNDLLDDDGSLNAQAGDKISAYVVSRKGEKYC